MERLTEKQRNVLGFIEGRLAECAPPSQKEIADHFGLAQNAAYQLIGYLRKKGYLEAGSGHRGIRLSPEYLTQKQSTLGLPVVGRVAAGEPILAEQNITDYVQIDNLIRDRHKDAFLLRVAGDSMVGDGILDGDYVIVRPQSSVENGQIAVVMVDDEATVKRVFFKPDRIILQSANPRYTPKVFKRGDKTLRVIGKVIGCFRTM